MELSELVTFDGRLLSEDDQVYPWVILMDGNGKSHKGRLSSELRSTVVSSNFKMFFLLNVHM